MIGRLHPNQPPVTTRPGFTRNFKLTAYPCSYKDSALINSNNDSGICERQEQSGNIAGRDGSSPGNDGMGEALHD